MFLDTKTTHAALMQRQVCFKMTAKQFRLENQQKTTEVPTPSGWTELQTPPSGWTELPKENQQPEAPENNLPQTPQTMSQIWQTQVDPNARSSQKVTISDLIFLQRPNL